MKLERRGKYPGLKLHLDGKECQRVAVGDMVQLSSIMMEVRQALKHDPSLLEERSEEEITATLMKEFVESEKKLAHIKGGLDWKKVKVEVVE